MKFSLETNFIVAMKHKVSYNETSYFICHSKQQETTTKVKFFSNINGEISGILSTKRPYVKF